MSLRVLSTLFLAFSLIAQQGKDRHQPGPWERHVMTAKGERFDTPTPHPLAFFTRYPAMLDEGGDFCYLCSPQKRLSTAMAAKEPKAEIHLVGVINSQHIYDVFYRFRDGVTVDWKSILVKTGPDLYREIHHRQPTQVDALALPSKIDTFGLDSILVSTYSVGGMHPSYVTDYYWFGMTGPVLVDISPIQAAANAALPEGEEFWGGEVGFTAQPVSPMKTRFGVRRKGFVEVTYTLNAGRVVVSEAHYYE